MKENFGDFLRRKRIEQRCSALIFAEKVGLTVLELSRVENDGKPPSKNCLIALEKELDLKSEELETFRTLAELTYQKDNRKDEDVVVPKDSKLRCALRVASDMDFTDEEWYQLYHSLPHASEKGGAVDG